MANIIIRTSMVILIVNLILITVLAICLLQKATLNPER